MTAAPEGQPTPPIAHPLGLSVRAWLPSWSASAAVRAARATVVVAGMFALTIEVVGNLQMATFAAFGGFATLVLTTFSGTRRDKLLAHAALAVLGSVLLTIGTLVSSSTLLATLVTVPVTFAVFFMGIAGPNAAAGVTGALLAYVLPVASLGTASMIPDRLAGWWLASVSGTIAVLLFSPRSSGERLLGPASRLAAAEAEQLDAALRGTHAERHRKASVAAKHELLERFSATPSSPFGLTGADQALADDIELLEWCAGLIGDTIAEQPDLRAAASADRELMAAAADVLRAVALLLAGGDQPPGLEELERLRARSLEQLRRRMAAPGDRREIAQIAFHANSIAVAALAIGANSLLVTHQAGPEATDALRRRWYLGSQPPGQVRRRLGAFATVAARNANVRSIRFVNSARGAVALAAAVAIADLSSVQHGFWVVFGTLSVLRTSAAATGSTALRALGGTALGFLVGGVLLLAIGSSTTALWVALPIAVFVSAYAPGTAPFAVGQAAFTVTVAVLFNLLLPVGWRVGVVRVEDVAIGCAVSVLVGALLWPRGLSSLVGEDLAEAFSSGAAYLSEAVDWACGGRATTPEGAVKAVAAASRLEDALRGFLAEQGTKRVESRQLWLLVGGTMRLRLTAHAIADLPHDATGTPAARRILRSRAHTLSDWYERLTDVLSRPAGMEIPELAPPRFDPTDIVKASTGSTYGVWLCEHLDHLSEHLADLIGPATRIAQVRRLPWWR